MTDTVGVRDDEVSPLVALRVMIVGVDAIQPERSKDLARLRDLAQPGRGRLPAQAATPWRELERTVDRLRSQDRVVVLVRHAVTARAGSRVTIDTPGLTRTSMRTVLRPVLGPTLPAQPTSTRAGPRWIDVDVGVEFIGPEPENRFRFLTFAGSTLQFMTLRLNVPAGGMDGGRLARALGRPTDPVNLELYAFVTAQVVD